MEHLIMAIRILVVALDVGLFYLLFWLINIYSLRFVHEWWYVPTFMLSTLLITIVGVIITIVAFHKDLEYLCKK